MTTYRKEQLTPRVATVEEAITIQRILDLREQQKQSYEEVEELYGTLPVKEPLVSKAKVYSSNSDPVIQLTTFVIDRPEWIPTRAVARNFEMKAKTTKQDAQILKLSNVKG